LAELRKLLICKTCYHKRYDRQYVHIMCSLHARGHTIEVKHTLFFISTNRQYKTEQCKIIHTKR